VSDEDGDDGDDDDDDDDDDKVRFLLTLGKIVRWCVYVFLIAGGGYFTPSSTRRRR